MNIQNYPNNQAFGCKLKTISVLESTTGKILEKGKSEDRINLIKNVLHMENRDLKDLNKNPLSPFLCLLGAGKILVQKNPQIASDINRLNEIMAKDKGGEVSNALIGKLLNKYGEVMDLTV